MIGDNELLNVIKERLQYNPIFAIDLMKCVVESMESFKSACEKSNSQWAYFAIQSLCCFLDWKELRKNENDPVYLLDAATYMAKNGLDGHSKIVLDMIGLFKHKANESGKCFIEFIENHREPIQAKIAKDILEVKNVATIKN